LNSRQHEKVQRLDQVRTRGTFVVVGKQPHGDAAINGVEKRWEDRKGFLIARIDGAASTSRVLANYGG
jgi:hypothetical protein